MTLKCPVLAHLSARSRTIKSSSRYSTDTATLYRFPLSFLRLPAGSASTLVQSSFTIVNFWSEAKHLPTVSVFSFVRNESGGNCDGNGGDGVVTD